MMKTTIALILVLLLATVNGFATKIADLDLSRPGTIVVKGDKLFVVDGTSIHSFSLKSGKKLTQFGREGEGPGEFKLNFLFVLTAANIPGSQNIFVDSFGKILAFAPEGKFLWEKKKTASQFHAQLRPLGKKYVGRKVLIEKDGYYDAIILYDEELKAVKELYRQRSGVQMTSTDMVPDSLYFCTIGDNIYVEQSREGFILGVFDSNGNRVNTIKKKYTSAAVTDKYKKQSLDEMIRTSALIKQVGWENFKKGKSFNYPERFPAIQDICNVGDNICIKTYNKKEGKQEYVFLDPKGKELKRIYLPGPLEPGISERIRQTVPRHFAFQGQYYYYLVENEEEENYQLHRVKL